VPDGDWSSGWRGGRPGADVVVIFGGGLGDGAGWRMSTMALSAANAETRAWDGEVVDARGVAAAWYGDQRGRVVGKTWCRKAGQECT